jgi:acyl-CoA thioesterase-1
MKNLLASLVVLGALACAAVTAAPPPAASAKKPDPAYAQISDDPKLPRVLLIGDSVSVGYTLAVRKELAGKANVHRPPANCGSTKTGLHDLDKWLGTNRWDVIHFNWGLHDLGYRFTENDNKDANGNYARPDNGGHQNVPPDQYAKNLRELVARLKKTGAKLIFATTTPVPADLHSYVKAAELPYNVVAKRIMNEEGVTLNDLWAFASPQLDQIQEHGNPHFTSKGSALLAQQIAQVIQTALSANAPHAKETKP